MNLQSDKSERRDQVRRLCIELLSCVDAPPGVRGGVIYKASLEGITRFPRLAVLAAGEPSRTLTHVRTQPLTAPEIVCDLLGLPEETVPCAEGCCQDSWDLLLDHCVRQLPPDVVARCGLEL